MPKNFKNDTVVYQIYPRSFCDSDGRVSKHAASSIDITARVWVNSGDYWTVNADIIEAVKLAFDKEGIEIPFDQLDVHVKND